LILHKGEIGVKKMNIFSAVFTGIAVSANPVPTIDTNSQAVETAAVEIVPDYSVAPLTDQDVSVYLDVMRAAADHVAHASGDDEAAVEFVRAAYTTASNGGTTTVADPQKTAMLLQRAVQLSTYDEMIAREVGIAQRYDAIKATIVAQMGPTSVAASCDGDWDKGTATPAQIEQGAAEAAAFATDKAVLAPHAAEIQALQNQVRGFMYGR
jgi:hypothetical protein